MAIFIITIMFTTSSLVHTFQLYSLHKRILKLEREYWKEHLWDS